MEANLESLTREWIESLILHRPPESGVDGILRASGVVHLYGASGIHLYAILTWLDIAWKGLGKRLGVPSKSVRAGILSSFLLLLIPIWKLQGLGFFLFRPLSSILIRFFIRESGWRVPILLPLILTFLIEGALSFKTGMSPGASHYYLAVGGALLALKGSRRNQGIRAHVNMAVGSWIPIALLDLFRDSIISPLTPLLSLLTISPVALVLFPLTTICMALSGGVPDPVFILWCHTFTGLIAFLDLLPGVFMIPRPALILALVLSLFYFATPICFRILGITGGLTSFLRLSACGALLFFLRNLACYSPPNQVVQIDVGQGDSALITAEGRAELVDVGSDQARSPEFWLRTLARYRINELDGVLLGHLDRDHAGGLHPLLSVIPVKCLQIHPEHRRSLRGQSIERWVHGLNQAIAIQGQNCLQLAKVRWFESRDSRARGNRWMAGLVRKLSPRESYFALGDGDLSQERQYLREFTPEIGSAPFRIWKAGHHGSRYSSGSGFLQVLAPDRVWVPVGRKNPYGHPSQEAMKRLQVSAGSVLRTDLEGDLVYREGEGTR